MSQAVGSAEPAEAAIPFETILEGQRVGDIPTLVAALRGRDPSVIAEALRSRDPSKIVAALRTGDTEAVVSALLADDPRKRIEARRGREAHLLARAIEARITHAEGSRRARRIAEALESRDPDRIVAALRGHDADPVVAALGAPDSLPAIRLLLARPPGPARVPSPGAMPSGSSRRFDDDRRLARGLVAAASWSRVAREVSVAFRGRDPARVIELLASGDPDRIAKELIDRDPGRSSQPISPGEVRRIIAALPAEDKALRSLAETVRRVAPEPTIPPLPESDARQIAEAIEGRDLDPIARGLSARSLAIWTDIFGKILPKVTAVARRKLGLMLNQPVEEEAESVALSVSRSFLSAAGKGMLYEYDLETEADLAAVLTRIAYRKCCQRLRGRYGLALESIEGADSALADTWFAEQVRQTTLSDLRDELDRFDSTLEPVDRIILREKLNPTRRVTAKEIAQAVQDECHRPFSTHSVKWHLTEKIHGPLRTRWERYAV